MANLLYYDGVYYGDWSVFPTVLLESEPTLAGRVIPFDPLKAIPPDLPSDG